MILSALTTYYERLRRENGDKIPQPGFARRNVAFALELKEDGALVAIHDLRQGEGKKKNPTSMIVPDHGVTRTSAAKDLPYFLCDTSSFFLGSDIKNDVAKRKAYFESSAAHHMALLKGNENPWAKAILGHFKKWKPEKAAEVVKALGVAWEDIATGNLVFALHDHPNFAHDQKALLEPWRQHYAKAQEELPEGQCLVTGKTSRISKLHSGLDLPGSQANGAPFVSFNQESFRSYGHEQGANAPVGVETVFAYTTAANELLGRSSRQKMMLGDMSLIFWAERACEGEDVFAFLADPPSDKNEGKTDSGKEIDPATASRVRTILESLRSGKKPKDGLSNLDPQTRFFVLGLAAPGGARATVRLWMDTSLGTILERIGRHFAALSIERQFPDSEPEFPSFFRLLVSTASLGKAENITPSLATGLARAAFEGTPYPMALLASAIERIRAESGNVTYFRAALIKACLVRQGANPTDQEKTLMTLDPANTSPGYLLGRLFAALEYAQKLALGKNINATIKDRYFGAASATPKGVFPNLIRLAQHHLSKADNSVWLDKKIGEIVEGIQTFPAHLSLLEQGQFALGYYHQRNAFYSSKDKTSEA